LQHYLDLEHRFAHRQDKVASSNGMIAGTNNPFAIHAGFEALKKGGSAADAALTAALAQIALSAGATISYAGFMTAVYYEAASDSLHTLNAAYNTVRNENDPLTIPGMGQPSGRSALVPGFTAGAEALHSRFGKLPFSALFAPAIWVAENGFTLSRPIANWLQVQGKSVTRLAPARRIFTKTDGNLYTVGDLFRQTELASTLTKIANLGSAYMYEGEWATHFVDAVRSEGGNMTLEDLTAYRAFWTDPIEISYRDYRVVTLGPPNKGGMQTLASLKLAEVADLKQYGHYTSSAQALYYLIQFSRIQGVLANATPSTLQGLFPNVDFSPDSRLTPETAQQLWNLIQARAVRVPHVEKQGPDHSAGVVVVDSRGNVASVLHTSNCILWGSTGIFVDGISIPDPASFQQRAIANSPCGLRLPDGTNPLIVLKSGKPALACAAIGPALHQTTLQNLTNIMDFGMEANRSVEQPNTRGPVIGTSLTCEWIPEYEKEAVGAGDFEDSVIEGVTALGQPTKDVGGHHQLGYWIGIQIEPETHTLTAGVTSRLNALAEGY